MKRKTIRRARKPFITAEIARKYPAFAAYWRGSIGASVEATPPRIIKTPR